MKVCQLEVRRARSTSACKVPMECPSCGWYIEESALPASASRRTYLHSKKGGIQ